VVVNSSGQLGVVTSSARYKKDIKPLAGASAGMTERLAQLRPVSFRYKSEPEATHYGLIAEEVAKVMPELVVRDRENRPDSVQYIEIVPLLLHQWKAERELNAQQEAEIARQRKLIERQEARLEREDAENARQRAVVAQQQHRLDRQEAELAELRPTLTTRLAALDTEAKASEAGLK